MELADLAEELSGIVGARFVRTERAELATFASDGLPTLRRTPALVVLPGSAAEVSRVLAALHRRRVPFVARGAGTGLSGGALGEAPAALVTLTRLGRILELDPDNRRAVVEPGVVNASLSRAAAPFGLMYAPDPSSQTACTIGGNVAENAGGPHCLKYGVTTNHVLELEVALPAARPGGPISSAPSSAARACSASRRRSRCAWCRCRPRCARCWPTTRACGSRAKP